jgi:hypothetical protein
MEFKLKTSENHPKIKQKPRTLCHILSYSQKTSENHLNSIKKPGTVQIVPSKIHKIEQKIANISLKSIRKSWDSTTRTL